MEIQLNSNDDGFKKETKEGHLLKSMKTSVKDFLEDGILKLFMLTNLVKSCNMCPTHNLDFYFYFLTLPC